MLRSPLPTHDEVRASLPPATAPRLLFVVNEGYFLLSHRGEVLRAARRAGFDVHVAAPPHHAWAPPGFELADLAAAGVAVHPIPLSRRGMNPFSDARTFLALLGLYRRLRPDVVHHVTIKPNLYGGLAARIARVPAAVFAVAGFGQLSTGRGWRLALARPVVRWLLTTSFAHPNARVIAQNPEDRAELLRRRMAKPSRMLTIRGSGVDLRQHRAMPEPDGPPVVALISRLIWDKGIQEFVSAAKAVRASGSAARFVLVGSTHASNPRAVPERQLREWHDAGMIEWWGFRRDVADVIASSHVVCLPTTYGEGVPKVLLEAAAGGRAVIASDIRGCREAVVDGRTGVLVPPGNVGALVAALQRLLNDPLERQAMGRAGRLMAEREFDERDVAAQTVNVYSSLLNNKHDNARAAPSASPAAGSDHHGSD